MNLRIKSILVSAMFLTVSAVFSTAIAGNTTIIQSAKSVSPALPTNAALLYVQSARSATITPIANKKNTYTLTLKNINPFVTYFSDRPQRISGITPISTFLKRWNTGENNFANNPPNASLSGITTNKKAHYNAVVMLIDPKFNPNKQTLSFKIKTLNGQPINVSKLGYTSLFIDFNWTGNTGG